MRIAKWHNVMYIDPVTATTDRASVLVTGESKPAIGLPYANVRLGRAAAPEMALFGLQIEPSPSVAAFFATDNTVLAEFSSVLFAAGFANNGRPSPSVCSPSPREIAVSRAVGGLSFLA